MGYDSTIYIGPAYPSNRDDAGRIRVYPSMTVSLPRFGWAWARDVVTLRSGPQTYRVMEPCSSCEPGEDGFTADAYGVPLFALRPKALRRYIEREHPSTVKLPEIAGLLATLRRAKSRSWREDNLVVIFHGH